MVLPKKVYMMGIGGMGMCPLALYLKELGVHVLGADDNIKKEVKDLLCNQGIIFDTSKEIPDDCDLVVYSSAISQEHSVIKEAVDRGIPRIRRGELLAQVLNSMRLLAVIGSHGKTTTTGMLVHTMEAIDFKAGYFVGALFNDKECLPARISQNEWVAVEVDESDGTIDAFSPEVALVVNFDWDHPNQYKTEAQLKETFLNLFRRTKQAVIIPASCKELAGMAKEASCEVLTYGEFGDYRGVLSGCRETSTLTLAGRFGELDVGFPNVSKFNAHNALGALAATHVIAGSVSKESFSAFKGIRRRQECLYQDEKLTIVMDYAHHPTELGALLECFQCIAKGKCIVIFQPHRYTRTRTYAKAFADILNRVDQVILLPVYAASEDVLEEGTSEAIYREFPEKEKLDLIDFSEEALFPLLPRYPYSENATVLFVGAGDIENLAREYGNRWRQHCLWQLIACHVRSETRLKEYEPLAKKTTLRLGGEARFYAEPSHLEDLAFILREAKQFHCPVFVLGRGSNLLVSDDGFQGIVLRLNHPYWKEMKVLGNGRLWVGAGVRLKEICGYACKWGLSGFEFLEGIPGSLGGALRMNAGAMGGWLYDVVESIERVTYDGDVQTIPRDDLDLGYRYCNDLSESVAVGATLKSPKREDAEKIRQTVEAFAKKRKQSQPREPSAGCIFKNPKDNYAGKLIESSGLKGKQVGGAEVSGVHANFIINRGKATSKDIVQLVRLIIDKVHAEAGIELEPEVLFLGKDWKEVLA